jgi:hypothetical protein
VVCPCLHSCAMCLEIFFSYHLDCTCILSCHQQMATLCRFVLSLIHQIMRFIDIHHISKIKIFSIITQQKQGLGAISRGIQAVNVTIITSCHLLEDSIWRQPMALTFWYLSTKFSSVIPEDCDIKVCVIW